MATSKPSPNPFDELIDGLENSFKTLVGSFCSDLIENRTNHENSKKTLIATNETNKISYEQNYNNLIEKARNLETLLLKTRLEISKKSPELVLKEECELLQAELNRKDELINSAKEKLQYWEQNLLNLDSSLDNRLKQRVEMCANQISTLNNTATFLNVSQNQINNSNLNDFMNPSSVSSQYAANQSFEQPPSLDNSIIILDKNGP